MSDNFGTQGEIKFISIARVSDAALLVALPS